MIVEAEAAAEGRDVGQLLLHPAVGGRQAEELRLRGVRAGQPAVADHHRSLEPQRGPRAPRDARVERPDPAVADVGGHRQSVRIEEVGLDVAPSGIGYRCGEADRVAAGAIVAHPQFGGRDAVAAEALDEVVADRQPSRPEALLIARIEDHPRRRLHRRGDRGQQLRLRATLLDPGDLGKILDSLVHHGRVARRGRRASETHEIRGQQPDRIADRMPRETRMGEARAAGDRQSACRLHGKLAVQRLLLDPVGDAGRGCQHVDRTDCAGDPRLVAQIARADHPAEAILHRPREPALGGEQRRVIILAKQAGIVFAQRRVEALVDILSDDRAGRSEAQRVPLLRDSDLAQPVIVVIRLGERARAGERRTVAVGILRVATVNVLRRRAQPDRPAVAGLDPHHRAPAGGADTVDVVATRRDVVDIAAVGACVADEAERHHIVDDREVDHRRSVCTGGAVRDRGDAGGYCRLEVAGHRIVADDPDDAAWRSGSVERALRPLQHLDRGDVVELQVGIGRVIGQPDVAEIFADGRLALADQPRIRDAADEKLVAAGAEMGRGHARGAVGDRIAAGRAGAAEQRSREDRDAARELAEPHVALARADDDVGLGCVDVADHRRDQPRHRHGRRDLPVAAADRNRSCAGAGEQLRERLLDRQAAMDGLDRMAPQLGVGQADADPGRPAERDDRIAQRTGRQIYAAVRRGIGPRRREQQGCCQDGNTAQAHCRGMTLEAGIGLSEQSPAPLIMFDSDVKQRTEPGEKAIAVAAIGDHSG